MQPCSAYQAVQCSSAAAGSMHAWHIHATALRHGAAPLQVMNGHASLHGHAAAALSTDFAPTPAPAPVCAPVAHGVPVDGLVGVDEGGEGADGVHGHHEDDAHNVPLRGSWRQGRMCEQSGCVSRQRPHRVGGAPKQHRRPGKPNKHRFFCSTTTSAVRSSNRLATLPEQHGQPVPAVPVGWWDNRPLCALHARWHAMPTQPVGACRTWNTGSE